MVEMGRNPFRLIVGDLISQMVIPMSIRTIKEKKQAVGIVQAIQSSFDIVIPPSLLYAAQGKALGKVVTDKIDHKGAGHNGENPGCCQQPPVQT